LDWGASEIRPAVSLPDGAETVKRTEFAIVERLSAPDEEMVDPAVAVAILGQEERMPMVLAGRTVRALAAETR
jgi:hypothetical protein